MNLASPARICVPICESNFPSLAEAAKSAAVCGDLVELRLDYLSSDELQRCESQLRDLLATSVVPLILTLRPFEQGGGSKLHLSERFEFWLKHFPPSPHYADLELDLAKRLSADSIASTVDWSRVICSHHDFVRPVGNLSRRYEELAATPARILKLAFQAGDVIECLPVFDLLARARREQRELIAIAMGEAGLATRVLGPACGSYLTYGPSTPETSSAPGQVTANDLRETYRIDTIDEQTQIVGLVGLPTAHSISPVVHNSAFASTGINARYLRFEVIDLGSFLQRMVHPRSREMHWNLRGLSITAPHKATVLEHLDWVAPAAKEIGAVNTVVVESDKLHGYNTDAEGFEQPLSRRLSSLTGLRCAVLGAGGVARTAVWVLKREGATVKIFARQAAKAQALAAEFDVEAAQLDRQSFADFDLVVNATPLGTAGKLEAEAVVTAEQLRGAGFVYDLVYNPKETQLMREARAAGCQTLGGVAMLVQQAAAQFRLWTGTEAPLAVMDQAAERALSARRS